jgi:hypothetical protein
MDLAEDNAGITNSADVVNTILGTKFNFGSSYSDTDKVAQYTFTFEARKNCELRSDQAEHVLTYPGPGSLKYFSIKHVEI